MSVGAPGPEEMRGAIVIMAKAPREGFVKTRLTGVSPPCDVVLLSECMLRDTLALVQAVPRVHAAVMCPPTDVAAIAARLPADVQVIGQDGQGLGAALVSVFERFVPCFGRVVALDADSPHLPPSILDAALGQLDTKDVVVGPTEDGGYYLVGASAMHPRLFDPAALGTRDACDALCASARALGLSVGLTDVWYDVDVPADLRRLAADLRIDPSRSPRTAAFLASWERLAEAQADQRTG
jgi:uncharacterized protein